MLTQANAAVDRELRDEALKDLCDRVDDWKNHRVDHFGDLLLHGHFPVVTGKSDVQKEVRISPNILRAVTSMSNIRAIGSKCKALASHTRRRSNGPIFRLPATSSQWNMLPVGKACQSVDGRYLPTTSDVDIFLGNMIFHHFSGSHPVTGDPFLAMQYANSLGLVCPRFEQYTIYLFERILLCCKEVNPNKSKDKIMGAQKDKKDKKDRNRKEPNRNAKLQLKGRIFMTNVTEVLSLGKQGNYCCSSCLILC